MIECPCKSCCYSHYPCAKSENDPPEICRDKFEWLQTQKMCGGRMIFNQKTLDLARLKLKITNEYSDGFVYEVWDRRRRDQEFAKQVFLGYCIVDKDAWENPYIYGERGYVYNEEA